MSYASFKTSEALMHTVEIVVMKSTKPGNVAVALYTGSASIHTSLTADDITKLIENLSSARDELIRAEFRFPAIEVVEVAA